jgi:hypothetical protein
VSRAVACQSPVHAKENILREILRFRAITREPVTNIEDPARMATYKFLPGRAIAQEALLDQLGILLQARLAPCSISPRTVTLQVVYRTLPNYGT